VSNLDVVFLGSVGNVGGVGGVAQKDQVLIVA